MPNRTVAIILFNFLLAALMGLTLRAAHIFDLPWIDYRKLTHGHSHVALLGWAYLALFILIRQYMLPSVKSQKTYYSILFWFTQVTVLGMAISFPLQGYAFWSILFSTLHVFASYFFAVMAWKDHDKQHWQQSWMLKTALAWMVLSSLGLWVLAYAMIIQGKNSPLYYMAIQFFLHCQFNGWFTFAVLALFFGLIGTLPSRLFKRFYFSLLIATALTYTLSVTWSHPHPALFWINGVGVITQLASLGYLLAMLWPKKSDLFKLSPLIRYTFLVAIFSFILKIIIQAAVVVPVVAQISYTIRQFVIGFVHLTMLGSISLSLLAILLYSGLLRISGKIPQWGMYLLLFGFLSSEFLLFCQGMMLWTGHGFIKYYYELLFYSSTFMPIGLILISLPKKLTL